MINDPIIKTEDLSIDFSVRGRILKAVRNVSFSVNKDEVLAIAGESGSGKTVLMRSAAGLLAENGSYSSGTVFVHGEKFEYRDLEKLRGKVISFVFQDPGSALNPVATVGSQIADVIRKRSGCTKAEARKKAIELLKKTGIADAEKKYDNYPFEYSGGMLQRAVIAIALACNPEILVCDEATTSLDVSVQYRVMELLLELKKQLHFSIVVITHDFGVVAKMADRAALMYAGEIVEIGKVHDIFYNPVHDYTKALLSCLPQLQRPGSDYKYLDGCAPSLYEIPGWDVFAPRNPDSFKIDYIKVPPVFEIEAGHFVKSWKAHPLAPKPSDSNAIVNLKDNFSANILSESFNSCADYSGVPLLSAKDLKLEYGKGKNAFTAVNGVSFDVYRGEILSIVGESGSGKTTIGKAIAGMKKPSSGSIIYNGQDIYSLKTKAERKAVKQKIQMIFQNQTLSLNDRADIRYIVSEGLDNFSDACKEEKDRKILDMLKSVGLDSACLSKYPHELSGGQRQRIGIARSLIIDPEIVIADEPVASLDVSIRAQILKLINKFRTEKNTAFVFISHDMSVVRLISDRIIVMQKGHIVEMAAADELFRYPMHPYTKALMAAVPIPDPDTEKYRIIPEFSCDDIPRDDMRMQNIGHNHYVLCNDDMLREYIKIRSKEIITNPLVTGEIV